MTKRFTFFVLVLSLIMACEKNNDTELSDDDSGGTGTVHESADDYTWDNSRVTHIALNGSSISVDSTGATVNGSKVTITRAGTYSVSGTLTDGQVIVNTEDTATVRVILNGATINYLVGAPIFISKATKTIIILADNTENSVTDAISYTDVTADNEPNAAIFSKSNLTLFGNGTLTVNAKYSDGITSKDGLIIKSGKITVTAVDDGIRGKDYLIVKDGNITLKTGGDGLKSDNEDNAQVGFISIEKGTVNIVSATDAIQAAADLHIKGGDFSLTSGGGSSVTLSSTLSAKGIKAGDSLVIESGTFAINSADDAIHSNANALINGGTFNLSAGDDGIHAETTLGVMGGDITITKSYEGLESNVITINSGNIHVTSSEDGINVGNGSAGAPGQVSSGNSYLYVNGGYIVVNGNGDGIDINGSAVMTGGDVLVNGPTANGNGPLDYDGSFKLTGGFVAAVGSSGMAQAPDATSSQNSLLLNFTSTQAAGTMVHVQTTDGKEVLTFVPVKKFQSLALSSPLLLKGSTYEVYLGGSSTGTVKDGLYSNGSYTPGTKYTSFTISTTVTKIGSSSGPGGW